MPVYLEHVTSTPLGWHLLLSAPSPYSCCQDSTRQRDWPFKDPSEPYREVKQKHFCVQRGLGEVVDTAIPSPLSLQGARADSKMPQGCGAREEGAEAPHRVPAADAGGEGPLVRWLAWSQAGWLGHMTLFSQQHFPRGFSIKGMGHDGVLI